MNPNLDLYRSNPALPRFIDMQNSGDWIDVRQLNKSHVSAWTIIELNALVHPRIYGIDASRWQNIFSDFVIPSDQK